MQVLGLLLEAANLVPLISLLENYVTISNDVRYYLNLSAPLSGIVSDAIRITTAVVWTTTVLPALSSGFLGWNIIFFYLPVLLFILLSYGGSMTLWLLNAFTLWQMPSQKVTYRLTSILLGLLLSPRLYMLLGDLGSLVAGLSLMEGLKQNSPWYEVLMGCATGIIPIIVELSLLRTIIPQYMAPSMTISWADTYVTNTVLGQWTPMMLALVGINLSSSSWSWLDVTIKYLRGT